MKKLILLVAAVAGLGSLNAQSVGKGVIALGGSVGFNSTTNKTPGAPDQVTTAFNITPGASYFITDDIAVGLNVGFRSSSTKVEQGAVTQETVNSNLNLSVGVTYVKMLNDQFGLWGGLSISPLGTGTTTQKFTGAADVKSTSSSFGANVVPGIIFFPAPKWGLTASIGNLGYNSVTNKNNADVETSSNSNFGLNFDLTTINFGVSYFIGRGE